MVKLKLYHELIWTLEVKDIDGCTWKNVIEKLIQKVGWAGTGKPLEMFWDYNK